MLGRTLATLYGAVCYVIFFATFLYAIAFVGNISVGNMHVPRSIDVGPSASLAEALLIDAVLLSIFAIQHSVMARAWFKRAWTRIVPQVVERSTFVLFSSLALILLFWQWRPITTTVWSVQSEIGARLLWVAFAAGWAMVLISTFLISHFELFGLSQVWAHFTGKTIAPMQFRTPFFYKAVRHPLYLGFMIAFWATPHMTGGHAFFAFMCTAYMLVAIQFEERDLVRVFGDTYVAYRGRVSMIIPLPKKSPSAEAKSTAK
jgi:protein-S-isoprenylcysteine O-methyltransferase Ste14